MPINNIQQKEISETLQTFKKICLIMVVNIKQEQKYDKNNLNDHFKKQAIK